MQRTARAIWLASLAVACNAALLSTARADLLNLAESTPDITSGFVLVSYTLSGPNGVFEAQGTASNLDFDGVAPLDHVISGGSFQILITVDPSTGLPLDGTLTITGTTDVHLSDTLLTGDVSEFGFQDGGGDLFEFTFDVTGGDLAAQYGAKAGVILNAEDSNFAGLFNEPFTNDSLGRGIGFGSSDTFRLESVPEPSTLLLGLAAVGIVVPARWRRGRAKAARHCP